MHVFLHWCFRLWVFYDNFSCIPFSHTILISSMPCCCPCSHRRGTTTPQQHMIYSWPPQQPQQPTGGLVWSGGQARLLPVLLRRNYTDNTAQRVMLWNASVFFNIYRGIQRIKKKQHSCSRQGPRCINSKSCYAAKRTIYKSEIRWKNY